MSLSGGQEKLQKLLKNLRLQWDEARADWQDGVATEYESNHVACFEEDGRALLKAMDRLGQALARARHDCS